MAISPLTQLLATLMPKRTEGVYIYTTVPAEQEIRDIPVVGLFQESEGVTLIVSEAFAQTNALPILFRAAWITLTVQSDLAAVGLTAAVSAVLADAGIACNVVAAAYHDHLFVPLERADDALHCLQMLQEKARATIANEP